MYKDKVSVDHNLEFGMMKNYCVIQVSMVRKEH